MKNSRWLVLAGLALAGVAGAQQNVYVASAGSDTNGGSVNFPFQTIGKALTTNAQKIHVAGGGYTLDGPVTLTGNRVIAGGYHYPDFQFNTLSPTTIILTSPAGSAAVILEDNASLQNVTLSGGHWSVEARETSLLRRVRFAGGNVGSVLARSTATPRIEKCYFLGGLLGVDARGQANIFIEDTEFNDLRGPAISAIQQSMVEVLDCDIVNGDSDGIQVFDTSQVLVQDCWIHRNLGAGIRVNGPSPVIRGNVIDLNQQGVIIDGDSDPSIRNNTIARNRGSGVLLVSGKPEVSQNIMALNDGYAMEEGESGVGGDFRDNLLWQNVDGMYLDGGTTPVLTLAVLHSDDMVTSGVITGNRSADPKFTNATAEDFRINADSPAVDQVDITGAEFTKDVTGVRREVNQPLRGNEGSGVGDIGAVEIGDSRSWEFGPIKTSWNPVGDLGIFNDVQIEDAPGGWVSRSDTSDNTFAFIEELGEISTQDPDTILVARYHLATGAYDRFFPPQSRLRLNAFNFQMVFTYNITPADQFSQVPPTEGRDYFFIVDLRNGGLRDMPAPPTLSFFADLDYMDFRPPGGVTAPVEWDAFELIDYDRTEFNSRFAPLAEFDFTEGPENWVFVPIPGFFDVPFSRWNAGKGALELAAQTSNSFAIWESKDIAVDPGDLLRITWHVSADETDPQKVAGFRMRCSSREFELTSKLRIDPSLSSFAAITPTSAGRDYISYVLVPPNFPVNQEFYLAFEIYGFAASQSNRSIYLENVKVEKADGLPPS